ncbi:MAG: type I restriction enzyme HsdR N-terminal domain-containing protein [Bacteroidales bacterium]|nr:type I restriction enzyme HsdR N-terminal domain-containing protein [Bacteroidales bacterium]
MEKLNLPEYSFQIRYKENKPYIFDEIRKKYLLLTPEEWVRQNFVNYLIHEKNYPSALIVFEKEFKINRLSKRSDIVVYNRLGNAIVLVECKAPQVKVSQKTFDQVSRYNLEFQVLYLMITNGLTHYCALIDTKNNKLLFMDHIPEYNELEIQKP